MNVLVIGSGGREHAICSSFRRFTKVERLFCANGNAGIARVAECVNIRPDDIQELADFAAANAIGLTFVGGEMSLALGIVDEFERRGLKIVGPNREAAQLESSKSFAKDFMARHGVPTAKYVTAHSPGFAVLELESGDFGSASTPVVVKAAKTNLLDLEDALNAIFEATTDKGLSSKADKVIVALVDYDKAFNSVVMLTTRRDTAVNFMLKKTGPAFEKNTANVSNAIASRQDAAGRVARIQHDRLLS